MKLGMKELRSLFLKIIIFLLIIALAVYLNKKSQRSEFKKNMNDKEQIISVVQINRHGARLPKKSPKGFKEKHFFGFKNMNLSDSGFKQHRMLGTLIRRKYANILKDQKAFKIFTSPFQRTIFSAIGFLQGVYPQSSFKLKYEEGFRSFQYPITETTLYLKQKRGFYLDSEEQDQEIELNVRDSYFHPQDCEIKTGIKLRSVLKNEKLAIKERIQSIEATEEEENAGKVLNKDFQIFNIIKKDFDNSEIKQSYESFFYHFRHLLTNKIEILEKTKSRSKKYSFLNPDIVHYSEESAELALSYYRKLLIKNFWISRINLNEEKDEHLKLLVKDFFLYLRANLLENSKRPVDKSIFAIAHNIHNDPDISRVYEEGKKYTIFSGHDLNIINIIANLFDNDWILENLNVDNYHFFVAPFASSLIFELVQKDEEYYVRIILNGSLLKEKTDNEDPNVFGKITNYRLKIKDEKFVKDRFIPKDGNIRLDAFLRLLEERTATYDLDCIMPSGSN